MTSPPYYGLRDYGIDGQIGLEPTPEEYIARLVDVFREVRRVLRDDGTLWLNIADTYAGSGNGAAHYPESAGEKQKTNVGTIGRNLPKGVVPNGLKPKDLIGIPWMLAFALRADGWYLRQDIIWSKPNPMPESVKDRCTKSHEYIFLFSKSAKYYFDTTAIKEDCVGFNNDLPAGSEGVIGSPNSRRRKGNSKTFRGGGIYVNNQSFNNHSATDRQSHGNAPNLEGKRNKRDVWTVSTAAYKEAHFATFPKKLIEPCIRAGCPERGIALDPFFGSGTVGEVAIENNRDFIGIEISPDYAEMSKRRLEPILAQTSLWNK